MASVESERKPKLDPSGSISFNYSCASPHTMETHNDLQKGIALIKKSVACITSYCYNSLCVDVPTDASTFESFANLLAILSSSKEVRSVFSLKMACSRLSSSTNILFPICLSIFFLHPFHLWLESQLLVFSFRKNRIA